MSTDQDRTVDIAKTRAATGPVAIVFADSKYREVLENWLWHAHAAGFSNTVVCSLDDAIHAHLQQAGVVSSRINFDGSLAGLWVERARLFAALCRAQVDFIHSDADAVWLKNPVRPAFGLDVDLALSQGTVWPPDIVKKWGFVLCPGFFAVRPGPNVHLYFEAVAARAETDRDDQAAINRTLLDAGITWQRNGPGSPRSWNGIEFLVYDEPVVGTSTSITAAMLPHRQFPRLPQSGEDAIVAHPLAPKTAAAKIELMRHLGLWKL